MNLQQPFSRAPFISPSINTGAGFDIPTGVWLQGKYGEWVLNGGYAYVTGWVGIANNFKSTLQRFQSFTASARMPQSTGNLYDTENNVSETRPAHLAEGIEDFGGEPIFDTGRWVFTNSVTYIGNKWYEAQRDFLQEKAKQKSYVDSPFLDRDGESLMKMMIPTFNDIDSFSRFETDDVIEMQDKAELGDSKGNTIHMRQGLSKTNFLMQAPRLNAASYNYLSMTAHLGKETTMQQGGGGKEVPIQKLKYLKNGDKIKGTGDQFLFLTHNCWNCYDAAPYINDTTKIAEYPTGGDNVNKTKLDTDLILVKVRCLRSKNGQSGMMLRVLASQQDGVLPSLTEFDTLKEGGRYGLVGTVQNYALAIYPDVKLSRTTVRDKIDEDRRLRRALNILMEMYQMKTLWNSGMGADVDTTPEELYENIKKAGYNWDMILETRGWWTYNNDQQPIPFLSSMDILMMAKGKYHPYWLEDDKKTIKKEFQKTIHPSFLEYAKQ